MVRTGFFVLSLPICLTSPSFLFVFHLLQCLTFIHFIPPGTFRLLIHSSHLTTCSYCETTLQFLFIYHIQSSSSPSFFFLPLSDHTNRPAFLFFSSFLATFLSRYSSSNLVLHSSPRCHRSRSNQPSYTHFYLSLLVETTDFYSLRLS
jgi:hypothetical protein